MELTGAVLLLLGSVAVIAVLTWARLHPFLVLFAAGLFVAAVGGLGAQDGLDALTSGFGDTVGAVGGIIVLGAIIGKVLERSGGALSMARAVYRLVGAKPAAVAPALLVVGLVVSTGVFADVGLIVLLPLAVAVTREAEQPFGKTALALSLGLSASHTMVPPTPGPVVAATILQASLGTVVGIGAAVSLCAASAGLLYGAAFGDAAQLQLPEFNAPEGASAGGDRYAGAHEPLVAVETHDASAIELSAGVSDASDSRASVASADSTARLAPSAARSLAPLAVPLVLIGLRSAADLPGAPFGAGWPAELLLFAGHPVVALTVGVGCALWVPRPFDASVLRYEGVAGEAITSAAPVVLLTAAGGGLGKALEAAGVGRAIVDALAGAQLGMLLPAVLAAVLKVAQGSGTVAITVTAEMLAPALADLGFDSPGGRALAVVAMGAGALVMPLPNDSYFWVFQRFTGATLRQTFHLLTAGSCVMGSAAVALVCLAWATPVLAAVAGLVLISAAIFVSLLDHRARLAMRCCGRVPSRVPPELRGRGSPQNRLPVR